jgi:hypothetical protein
MKTTHRSNAILTGVNFIPPHEPYITYFSTPVRKAGEVVSGLN